MLRLKEDQTLGQSREPIVTVTGRLLRSVPADPKGLRAEFGGAESYVVTDCRLVELLLQNCDRADHQGAEALLDRRPEGRVDNILSPLRHRVLKRVGGQD